MSPRTRPLTAIVRTAFPTAGALVMVFALCPVSPAAAAARSIVLEPCQLTTPGSTYRVAAECGHLTVPADRSAPSSKTIDLRVAVLPAVSRNAAPDAIFFLAGGPGQAATEAYGPLEQALKRLNEKRDIVLVDQRGTGGSNRLGCARETDPENFGSAETEAAWMKRCLDDLQGDSRVVNDLRLFTTTIAMTDLDDVRKALGYETIDLIGGSYGTRAALTYMRQYPDRVRAVVLDGVVPQDHDVGQSMAGDAQRSLDLIFKRCADDDACRNAFPDVKGDFRKILEDLDRHPRAMKMDHPVSGAVTSFTLTRALAAAGVRFMTYSPEMSALLPLLVHQAAATGDYDRLAAQVLLAYEFTSDSISPGMMYSVLCAEDMAFLTPEALATDGRSSYLGTAATDPMMRLCKEWPRAAIPASFKEPVRSAIPTLLLSGEADPVTPPGNGERTAGTLSNSRALVAPGMGHGISYRGCVPRLIADFFDAGSLAGLDTSCVKQIEPIPFFLTFAGPHP
jgi:pimeloyl-ACP methyl ester carboxylesterase